MIKHFVFTNFGIGISDVRWLLYRLELFERTVFLSLNAQTNMNFVWYVFVDERIEFIFRNRLELLASRASCVMRIVFVRSYSLVRNDIQSIIKSGVDSGDTLITTRIDDDDLITKDAVLEIQRLSETNGYYVLTSFKRGYEYLAAEGLVREVEHETIALGLSIISPVGKDRLLVTDYAHHIIVDTLKKRGLPFLHRYISENKPSWFYTKHSISDSVFFGARARILGDEKKVRINKEITDGFGASWEDFIYLERLTSDAPLGMPHKYLDKLANTEVGDQGVKRNYSQFATRENPARKVRFGERVRVAILGSCVTRDLFEFEPQLKEKFEIVFYSARSSVVSYCSLPNVDKTIRIGGEGFEDQRAQFDLDKSYWCRLRDSSPDVVLVDFIDERIGLIRHGGSYFTASGPVVKAFERSGADFKVIRPWDTSLAELRSWSASSFMERVRDVCQNIIVHRAKWCSHFYDENRSVKSFSETKWARQVELNNLIIDSIFSVISNHWVPFDLIEVGDNVNYAGGRHKWDLSPFHYDSAYYRQLSKLLLNRTSLD